MLVGGWHAGAMLRHVTTALVLVVALSGCAGIGQPEPYDSVGINGLVIPTPSPDPRDFVDTVDNPWLPLEPGARWSFDVVEEGATVGSLVVDVLAEPVPVAGLAATRVETTTVVGSRTPVVTTALYAQDDDGNVWLVGADAAGDGWRAGEAGAEAGLAMPADPRLGDGWQAYVVPGLPPASIRVEDQSREMVQVLRTGSPGTDASGAGTTTRAVHEKGAGPVSIEDLDGGWLAIRS